MRIIGGNFGARGTAAVTTQDMLFIKGEISKSYTADEINSVTVSKMTIKKFGVTGFIIRPIS